MIEELFNLLQRFLDWPVQTDIILNKFHQKIEIANVETIKQDLEYIKGSAFICETSVMANELYKHRHGQYVKYKTIPKWHRYALDMIK